LERRFGVRVGVRAVIVSRVVVVPVATIAAEYFAVHKLGDVNDEVLVVVVARSERE
jgi:hypothetical protein